MKILTTTEARKTLYQLVDTVAMSHEPTFIKGKRNTAVMLSLEDWQGLKETLYLYSIPDMVESIQKAAKEPLEEWLSAKDLWLDL